MRVCVRAELFFFCKLPVSCSIIAVWIPPQIAYCQSHWNFTQQWSRTDKAVYTELKIFNVQGRRAGYCGIYAGLSINTFANP